MIPGRRAGRRAGSPPPPMRLDTRVLNVSVLPIIFLSLATSRASERARRAKEESRAHRRGASVRALERHDDASSLASETAHETAISRGYAIQRAIRRECAYTGCIARVARFLHGFPRRIPSFLHRDSEQERLIFRSAFGFDLAPDIHVPRSS